MPAPIYLDWAAATPVRPEVLRAMSPYWMTEFGNPSSLTSFGQRAQAAIAAARQTIADVLDAHPDEILFTGSGTESINLAIRGVMARQPAAQLVVSAIEHAAVLKTAAALRSAGATTVVVPVSADGRIDPAAVLQSITETTQLVSVMYANNEIGTVQPIDTLGRLLRQYNRRYRAGGRSPVLLHTDACQAAGYLNLSVRALGVDLLSLNAAKIGGPKGVGLLYVRRGTPLQSLITGGGQEFGYRAGTENVAGIVGLATALRLTQAERSREASRIGRLRDDLLRRLRAGLPELVVHGSLTDRLPNNLSFALPDIDAETLVAYLDQAGVSVGTGAACSSRTLEPSHVLTAIGQAATAFSTLRLTLGRTTTAVQIRRAAAVIVRRAVWLAAAEN